MAAHVARAYGHCQRITRARARNFSYGIRLLPADRRRMMCAVYAFARRVDDIGDGSLSPADKQTALERVRSDLRWVTAAVPRQPPRKPDPVLVALADAASRHPIPLEAFGDLIDGVAMDVSGVSYRSFDALVAYCRRVAGSIGRLSVGVFGLDGPRAYRLGDDLGVAMQLTNILRDVGEDLEAGRIYLPRADRELFGCDLRAPRRKCFTRLIRFEVRHARRWFERGLGLLDVLDGRSAACVGAMTGIYRRLLDHIDDDPTAVLARRLSLSPWEKAQVAVTSLMAACRTDGEPTAHRAIRRSVRGRGGEGPAQPPKGRTNAGAVEATG